MLYCRSGTWRAVCSSNFNCYTAKLMCQQMGYPGALSQYLQIIKLSLLFVATRNYYYYGDYSVYDYYRWSCSATHTSLSQCSSSADQYCCSYSCSWWGGCYCNYCYYCTSTTLIGVVCYSPAQGNINRHAIF